MRPRSVAFALLLALGLPGLGLADGAAATASPGSTFPPPLSAYTGEEGMNLSQVLAHRATLEPLNLIATVIFLMAVLHTFAAPKFLELAHRVKKRYAARHPHRPGEPAPVSPLGEVLHFFGEVEAIFGLWTVPLIGLVTWKHGWSMAERWIGHGVHFTEPMFVVVIMAISSTRPVMAFAESMIGAVAGLGHRSPVAWWLSILTLGPLLGSFITEPAAMVISALLLGRQFFELHPSQRLRYATVGLLFVNVSVGGTLTHFAAPPVLMVAGKWGWGFLHMIEHFGWKAVVGITVSTALYWLIFRRELSSLAAKAHHADTERKKRPVPKRLILLHLLFLAWTVFTAQVPVLFIGGFLFFLGVLQVTEPHQEDLRLRSPLLVGFFLAGLVVHGSLQQWWIAPVLSQLAALPLMIGSTVLTAFNDNAAITYLASLVPGFDAARQYAVVAGAVTGGGLTVIANAPNPAGQSALQRYFHDGLSPVYLFAGALAPTLIVAACFLLL
ncbi:MAG: putative Na+/H+ antiporter [Acidobacteriota bacterium]